MASGVLSLIAATASSGRQGINLAAAICAGGALLMIACAGATATAGIDLSALVRALSQEDASQLVSRGWITFLFVRMFVIFYAFVALMSAGLGELLVSLNTSPAGQEGGRSRQ